MLAIVEGGSKVWYGFCSSRRTAGLVYGRTGVDRLVDLS